MSQFSWGYLYFLHGFIGAGYYASECDYLLSVEPLDLDVLVEKNLTSLITVR